MRRFRKGEKVLVLGATARTYFVVLKDEGGPKIVVCPEGEERLAFSVEREKVLPYQGPRFTP